MPSTTPHHLVAGDLRATIWPDEGAVMTDLVWRGVSVLCHTPWAPPDQAAEIPAPTEEKWVERWRGGWQLCAPSTGEASANGELPAFHGRASQAPWTVVSTGDSHIDLQWHDPLGVFHATRRWAVSEPGVVEVHTTLHNVSDANAPAQVAEHLVLGSDFLASVVDGDKVDLHLENSSRVVDLDYRGGPTGVEMEWGPQWSTLTGNQPGHVFIVTDVSPRDVTVHGGPVDNPITARISWDTVGHLLVWQEFAASAEHPWNSEVLALGLEPTSTAHGLGLDAGDAILIAAGQSLTWSTTLQLFAGHVGFSGVSADD